MKWFKRENDYPEYWNTYSALFLKKLPADLSEVPFVVLDTETTGFDFNEDRILSIGALPLKSSKMVVQDVLDIYLHQQRYKKESATVHGILKESKKDRISEGEAMERFLDHIGNAVIIAHHARFDIKMLNMALHRLGLPSLKNKYIDTATLHKKTMLRSNLITQKEHYSLDELADIYDISLEDRHTALGDAYITAIVFLKIRTRLKEKGSITLRSLVR